MAKNDTKVFDVAKPGDSKPETGSKPMVVGHKFMKDTSVTEPDDNSTEDIDQPIAQTSKRVISPINEEKNSLENTETKNEDETETESTNNDNASVNQKTESTKPSINSEDNSTKSTETEKTTEKPQEKIVENEAVLKKTDEENANDALSNEENLQRIISEKTYFVDVNEVSYSSIKTFVKTFIIVGTFAVVVIVILVDLEILDLGIQLPFDLL